MKTPSGFAEDHLNNNSPEWLSTLDGGRYHFLSRLASNVSRARDLGGEIVAVKKHIFPGPDGVFTYDSPEKEIEIHRELDHPHIVRFIRSHEGYQYIVTRCASGQTLARAFFDNPAGWDETYTILSQLTGTVAYLHSKSIIHRD